MKNIFRKIAYLTLSLALASTFTACSDDDGTEAGDDLTPREQMLKAATEAFVNKTVIPTYKSLADECLQLLEKCETMQAALAAGNLTTAQVKAAGDEWISARKYWELSEAFLFGAATERNIDPHIDSWPLDDAALQALLNNTAMMNEIAKDGYVVSNLGYGLLGFHALEYMLFERADQDGRAVSQPRSVSKYTTQEMVYLVAVAGDLAAQCALLEASWAGTDNVSAEKQALMEDAELEPTRNHGNEMVNAGKAGSSYVNYLAAAQEMLIAGCVNIADEVGAQKIGRPAGNTSSSEGSDADKNYIESPYSLNSQTDFADNIISVQRVYQGTNSGDASISDYIKTIDADLDTQVRETIQTAIDKIQGVTAQFETNASDAAWKAAGTYCANDLCNMLNRVNDVMTAAE